MNQVEFKKWLTENYPNLKPITISTTVSDAFYIFNHDIFEDVMEKETTDISVKDGE